MKSVYFQQYLFELITQSRKRRLVNATNGVRQRLLQIKLD